MKKHLSFLVLFIAASFTCSAYGVLSDQPEQADTLVVTSIKCNKKKIDTENWPFDVIYKSLDKFIFGERELKLLETRSRPDENDVFILADISSSDGDRYELLYKKKSKGKVYIKFSDYEITCINKNGGWNELDKMPSFMGGSPELFSKWVTMRLVYPKEAEQRKVQGWVIVQFTVQTDGSVTDVNVLHGVDASLDREAVRVVSSSPKWSPGKKDGKPVVVTFTHPVIFQLKES